MKDFHLGRSVAMMRASLLDRFIVDMSWSFQVARGRPMLLFPLTRPNNVSLDRLFDSFRVMWPYHWSCLLRTVAVTDLKLELEKILIRRRTSWLVILWVKWMLRILLRHFISKPFSRFKQVLDSGQFRSHIRGYWGLSCCRFSVWQWWKCCWLSRWLEVYSMPLEQWSIFSWFLRNSSH